MSAPASRPPVTPHPSFRATLVRVLIVQAVTLALLGIVQAVYGVGAG